VYIDGVIEEISVIEKCAEWNTSKLIQDIKVFYYVTPFVSVSKAP
jgi:hypothetical protein